MRTLEKDVLMICKRQYNSDTRKDKKYEIEDALLDYQALKTGCDKKYINENDVFLFSIMPTLEKFCKVSNFLDILQNRMSKDIVFASINKEEITLTQKYINNVCINELALLNVRDNDDKWIIDMSDYENVKANTDWWKED